VGERLPRARHRALRAHADPGGGVGQQHPLPGHGRGVRQRAHRAALPGARDRGGPVGEGLVRAGPATARAGSARARAVPARSR
jgi:hypothetical protein